MRTRSPGTEGPERWAVEEFGGAQLGNKLRTGRLVAMARETLRRPAGLVTEVFCEPGDREGAYKFLENERVSAREITASARRAAAKRASGLPFAFAPVDGSSASLKEYEGEAERGVGAIGAFKKCGEGALVMNAMVIEPDGTPLGVFDQRWWVRKKPQKTDSRRRKLEDKETKYWLEAIEAGAAEWTKTNPTTRLWFQLDRGGDFHQLLSWAAASTHWLTVRAAYDRRTINADSDIAAEANYLWATLEACPVGGKMSVDLPETKNRAARTATLQLRWTQVWLRLTDRRTKKQSQVALFALLARETETPADGSEPVEWMLLTNHEIRSLDDARLVLFGYTQRWRIEQFHRTWKSICKIEKTQLREIANFERWAAILASVAMRMLRLTYLARTRPGTNADTEFSRAELTALILEKGQPTHKPGDSISIGLAVSWIAEWGGYVGETASGGPPGTTVLARGLRDLECSAKAIAQMLDYTGKN